MDVYLFRRHWTTHTEGWLIVGDQVLRTLENPWLDNQRNVSCFPAGTYETAYLSKSSSGKYRKVWHIRNVPNRGGILIHNGNLVDHTKGCILIGTKTGRLGGQPAVLDSRTGMRKLLNAIGEQGFTLHVRGKY